MKTLHIDYVAGFTMFVSGRGTNVTVKQSKTGCWTESLKGAAAVSIKTLSEVDFEVTVGTMTVELDISELGDLRLALNELAKRNPNFFTKYTRVVL